MFRIDGATAAALLPSPGAAGTPGYFQNQTIVTPDWLNMVQEELLALLTAAGVTPSKTTFNQVKTALDTLYGGGGNLSSLGWQRLPGGLILQWGSGGSSTGSADEINFPLAFPNARYALNINEANASGWASNNPTVLGISPGPTPLASFRIYTLTWSGSGWGPSGGIGYSWMAVGR